MKKIITWILIADGTQARVLEHTGPGKGLVTIKGLDWSIPPLQTQDINADRPGRSHSSVGSGRSAMEPKTAKPNSCARSLGCWKQKPRPAPMTGW